jgi:hypothetical protein
VDWAAFWSRERNDADWLLDPFLARGRGHVLYAAQKAQKSLLMLWAVAKLATGPEPIFAVYLDFEMSEDDIFERLTDMGYGSHSDLSRLRYALLPSLPPLDQPEGAAALLDLVDLEQAARPDHHGVVIIDTTSRAVAGDENSADTIRAFYRHTGIGLKQRKLTWARLDHSGKDTSKGQRGSSAKGDDVDVIWRLEATDGGVVLRRDAARMGWVPERVPLARHDDPLRFEVAPSASPPGTSELVDVLDALGVADDASVRASRLALTDAEKTARNVVLRAAVKARKARLNDWAHPWAHRAEPETAHRGAHSGTAAETQVGTPLGTPGHTPESEGGCGRISRYGTPPDHDDAVAMLRTELGVEIVEDTP